MEYEIREIRLPKALWDILDIWAGDFRVDVILWNAVMPLLWRTEQGFVVQQLDEERICKIGDPEYVRKRPQEAKGE